MKQSKNLFLFILVGYISACATASPTPEKKTETPEAAASKTATPDETLSQINRLNSKIETLENRLEALNDKLETTRATRAVQTHPTPTRVTEKSGEEVKPSPAPTDPEAAFTNDPAIQAYRNAMIFFEAQKYPDAVLAFTGFLENYPDHPLAGSAQYFIGKSYYSQKEYKLAIREYKRVLTSYDRSSHVADTLREIADSEEKLSMNESAAQHRMLLTSLFAHSPAAGNTPKKAVEKIEEKVEKKSDIPTEVIKNTNPALDEPPAPPTAPIKP